VTQALVVFNAADPVTRLAAEEIALGIARAGRITTFVSSLGRLSSERVAHSGIVVLGAPASAREAAREVHELEGLLAAGTLEHRTVSVFDVGPHSRHGAGVRRLRTSLQEADPGLHLAAPGISVLTDRVGETLPEPEAARCRQFGEHLAGLAVAEGTA
jgi:flavorubredoxin